MLQKEHLYERLTKLNIFRNSTSYNYVRAIVPTMIMDYCNKSFEDIQLQLSAADKDEYLSKLNDFCDKYLMNEIRNKK